MILPFRQGIVRYTSPQFTQQHSRYINLVASTSSPLLVTIAAGTNDYLHAETADITNAWGPIPPTGNSWLFLDINTRTAVRTFGITLISPIVGNTTPVSPTEDQHWFDTSTNKLYVWTSGSWVHKIRIILCRSASGQLPISVSANSPIFSGTQIGDYTQTATGYILRDANNQPIRTKDGSFVTTEDALHTSASTSSEVKLASLIVEATSVVNIPAYSVVEFIDFGTIGPGNAFTTTSQKQFGIIETPATTGSTVRVVSEGTIRNSDWDWTTVGMNTHRVRGILLKMEFISILMLTSIWFCSILLSVVDRKSYNRYLNKFRLEIIRI